MNFEKLSISYYSIGLLILINLFSSCASNQNETTGRIMTVTGPISLDKMGLTLEHEHVVVDFTGAEKVSQPQYLVDHALDSLLPYFIQLKERGVQTFIECTPNYIGRDVKLLKAISEQTDLNILTNTGYYAAANKKYLPAHAYTESADQLAKRWITEWKNGIDGTKIRPGFIKLGVGNNHLDSIEQKIVHAGAKTHIATGLKLAIHTGGAMAANDEIDILLREGVDPAALVIVHAQNCTSAEQLELLKRGAWISLDGVGGSEAKINQYTSYLEVIKKAGFLHQTLLSQDAYWLVVKKESEEIKFEKHGSSYTAILTALVQNLKSNGFAHEDIDQLLIKNPARAYSIEVLKKR